MLLHGLLLHPLIVLGFLLMLFAYSIDVRGFLWDSLPFAAAHWGMEWLWLNGRTHIVGPVLLVVGFLHVVVRFSYTKYALDDDYLYISSGFGEFGSHGGFF